MSPIPSYTPEQLTQATADWSTCIGKGGYGDVFAGKLSGQEVAVKRMNNAAGTSPVGHAAFEREMLVSQVLTHDSVVPVIGFSQQGSSRCLVYPLHQGSLEDRQAIRLRIAADLASTLQAMHAKGVVHGDVKAGNVLLTTELRGLFTDFGQAHVQPELCETSELQRPSERDTLARQAHLGPSLQHGRLWRRRNATCGNEEQVWYRGVPGSGIRTGHCAYGCLRHFQVTHCAYGCLGYFQ
eukprot:gene4546-5567_t